jgi:hypothetical protein
MPGRNTFYDYADNRKRDGVGEFAPDADEAKRVLARWVGRVAEQVWIVKDWDNRTEYLRDCVWPVPAADVASLVKNTSLMRRGNPRLFKTEGGAMREFERRMKSVDAMMLAAGYYRHMHSDGRVIFVNTDARR